MLYQFEQHIGQLEKRKGGYYYLLLAAEIVNQFPYQQATRLVCTLDDKLSLSCGLNHFGDGNFFIIIASRHLKALGKTEGDMVSFALAEDPNPLGVAVPEVLGALLAQDDVANEQYGLLSDGKKRSLIHTLNKVKDLDKQVHTALAFLSQPQRRGQTKTTSDL